VSLGFFDGQVQAVVRACQSPCYLHIVVLTVCVLPNVQTLRIVRPGRGNVAQGREAWYSELRGGEMYQQSIVRRWLSLAVCALYDTNRRRAHAGAVKIEHDG